jgi:hypothetical protein
MAQTPTSDAPPVIARWVLSLRFGLEVRVAGRSVTTGLGGSQNQRHHRYPGAHPLIARRFFAFSCRSPRRAWTRAHSRRGGLGVLSGEGGRNGQGRAVRKPFSSTKCSARSVRRSAMTWALSASGKTLVQSLNARLVVMQVERRKS